MNQHRQEEAVVEREAFQAKTKANRNKLGEATELPEGQSAGNTGVEGPWKHTLDCKQVQAPRTSQAKKESWIVF